MSEEIIIVPALFATVGFIVWTVASSWLRSRHLREMTAFHARIVDRMGSVHEFNDFMQTPGGREFMNMITADRGPAGPRERILRAVQIGVVLTSVAVGCLILSDMFGAGRDETSDAFTILGVILLSLGIGFLISAASSYGLGRRLGVLTPPNLAADLPVSSE